MLVNPKTETAVARKPKKPRAQPRALQDRPTISFRTDRPFLEAIDEYARLLGITRNDLMEAFCKLYLKDRGEDLKELLGVTGGIDVRQPDIFS